MLLKATHYRCNSMSTIIHIKEIFKIPKGFTEQSPVCIHAHGKDETVPFSRCHFQMPMQVSFCKGDRVKKMQPYHHKEGEMWVELRLHNHTVILSQDSYCTECLLTH